MIHAAQGGYYFVATTLTVVVGLAVTIGYNPGCGGSPSPVPCDYLGLAESAAAEVQPFSPYGALEAVERGRSAYVHQPDRTHEAGVLIDRESCRVCRVDRYSILVPDFLLTPGETNGPMLAYRPPRLAPEDGPPDVLWQAELGLAELRGLPPLQPPVRDASGRRR